MKNSRNLGLGFILLGSAIFSLYHFQEVHDTSSSQKLHSIVTPAEAEDQPSAHERKPESPAPSRSHEVVPATGAPAQERNKPSIETSAEPQRSSSGSSFQVKIQSAVSVEHRERLLEVLRTRYPVQARPLKPALKPSGQGSERRSIQTFSDGQSRVGRVKHGNGSFADVWTQDGWKYYVKFTNEGVPENLSASNPQEPKSERTTLFFDRNGSPSAIAWVANDLVVTEFIVPRGDVKYRLYEGKTVIDLDHDLAPVQRYQSQGDGWHYAGVDRDGKAIGLWKMVSAVDIERVR